MNVRDHKSVLLSVLVFLLVLPVRSQESRVKIYSTSSDSVACGANISAYRTFHRLELYSDAQPTWLRVFDECPDFSERVYVDGAAMYQSFIENTPAGPLRESRIDTLMMIYDRRMEYFGGEGNVLGRKGRDLLAFRGSDLSQVRDANEMLRKSVEIQGEESQEAVLGILISSGVVLNKNGLLEKEKLIADYVLVTGYLVRLEKKNSRWERSRSRINEILLKENILSCGELDSYFQPLVDQHKNDTAFLEMVISSYSPVECPQSPVILAASENLYQLAPGPEAARSLALQFIARDDLEKAAFYLQEALRGEDLGEDSRAQWYYELAVINNALEDYCMAITYARESIKRNGNKGEAYMLLGDAVVSSRKSLGDDFNRRTAFWVAADMYEKASSLDPELSEEALKKLNRAVAQFPHREDIFFRDIREGEAYVVEGCINDTTIVRSRE